jgi:hypothetical protein
VNTTLASRRELLLQRSQLMRLQLRREGRVVRESLRWQRTAATVVAAPAMRRLAFGMALSVLGAGRAFRIVTTVGRIVLAIQLGRTVLKAVRNRAAAPSSA